MPRFVKISALVIIFGSFAVSVGAGVIAAQQAVEQLGSQPAGTPPTASNQFAILVTTIAGFASLLATQFFQMYRESQKRKWDLQDRETARLEMRQHARFQKEETLKTAVELARVSIINRDTLIGAIKENTQLTEEGVKQAGVAASSATSMNESLDALRAELASFTKKPETKAEA